MRRFDRTIGIVLGLALGVAVVAGFVFVGSESTIDAPRISGVDTGKPPRPEGTGATVVRVIGGAPPPSGPVRLVVRQGRQVRLRIVSDAAIGTIEVVGLGVTQTIDAGSTAMSFKAARAGQFPVIVSASHIGVASVRVTRAP
jgi:hypothetical protein